MREIVSPISGIRSPFGQRREVSLLALYAANGLNPSLVIDAKTPRYFLDGVQSDLVSVTDHSRASGATYLDSSGTLQTAASGEIRNQAYAYVDGVLTGPYVLTEPDAVNLLHSTDALVTQTEEVTAQPYTLQFTGTGIVTLLGAYSGSLVGTGAGEVNRVYLTFTPTAGTLTITVSGTVTDAQLEAGSIPTSYIPNLAGSGSAARAEDVLTIPDAPWPAAVEATGTELVTNGTFDTDISGWTLSASTPPTWNAAGTIQFNSDGVTFSDADQSFTTVIGATYLLSVSQVNVSGSGSIYVGTSQGSANLLSITINALGTLTYTFTATTTTTWLRLRDGSSATNQQLDNISVKEITPRAIGISMKGLMTYADDDVTTLDFYDWAADSSNYIDARLVTVASRTGQVQFQQEESNILDFAESSTTTYSPGINVPFSIASRHGDNFINGAVDGTALTANLTPTILPDLSATPIQIRPGGGPLYIEEMRIWVEGAVDKITDTLIEEASA